MSITNPFLYLQDSLDANGAVKDESTNNTSFVVSGVVEDRDGEFGSCFKFSDGAFFRAQNLTCTDSFTFALWVKLPVTQEEGRCLTLLEFGTNAAIRFCLRDLKPSLDSGTGVIATQRLNRDTWYHLAISFDATTNTGVLYINGLRDASGTGVKSNAADLLIGLGHTVSSNAFEGKLAHILVYNRVLSADDVSLLVNTTRKKLKPILLLQDTTKVLSTGTGTVKDDSGNGNDCTAYYVNAGTDDDMGSYFDFGTQSYLFRSSLECPKAFTLSAWIWMAQAPASSKWMPLVEYTAGGPYFGIKASKLTLCWSAACTTPLPYTSWQHVVVTYNPISTRAIIYLNGTQVAESRTELTFNKGALFVGSNTQVPWGADNFLGRMARIAVHNTALSLEDVQTLRTYTNVKPILRLPLETVDKNGRTPDISSKNQIATCTGVAAVTDGKFSNAITFDGVKNCIEVANLVCPTSFTFSAYVNPDSITYSRNVSLLKFGGNDENQPDFGLLQGRLRLYKGAIADDVLWRGDWHHVAVTYDDATKQVVLYVNGTLVKSGTYTGAVGGTKLSIGYRAGTDAFKGRMRHLMVHNKALSPDAIRQIIADTEPPGTKATSVLARPLVGLLTMDLVNAEDEPVVYIHHNADQTLSLSIQNTSGTDIRLVPMTQPVGPDCYHFQFHFRQGLLNTNFREALATGVGDAIDALSGLGWNVHLADLGTGGDQISLLWRGVAVAPQNGGPPYLVDGVIQSRMRALLPLRGIEVKPGSGSRTTRVLMRYSNLRLPDGTDVPAGQRIELLNILYRSQASAEFSSGAGALDQALAALTQAQANIAGPTGNTTLPVEVKLTGANTIVNDGGANTLGLTISNVFRVNGNLAPLMLFTGANLDTAPKFYLKMAALFDAVDGSSLDDINQITIAVASSVTSHTWTCSTDTVNKRWRLIPPTDMTFQAGETVTVTFGNLKTSENNGTIYLTVRYEDIRDYGDGDVYVSVKIAPLLFSRKSGKDTVVIRHGDLDGADPTNEALYVETSEGNAARFVGGNGVKIEKVSSSANALKIMATTSAAAIDVAQSGAGLAAKFDGGAGVQITASNTALAITATTPNAGVYVTQNDGTGYSASLGGGRGVDIRDVIGSTASPLSVYGNTGGAAVNVMQGGLGASAKFSGGDGVKIVDAGTASYGLYVKTKDNGTQSAIRVEKKGASSTKSAFDVDTVTSDPAVNILQGGTGASAKFDGGAGVKIINAKSNGNALEIDANTTTSIAALDVAQTGVGLAAKFDGGAGVQITASNTALNITATTPNAGVLVRQNGTGRSGDFTGGAGLFADNITVPGSILGAPYIAKIWGPTQIWKPEYGTALTITCAPPNNNLARPLLEVGQMNTDGVTWVNLDTQCSAKFRGYIEAKSYNNSDFRLKEDIQPLGNALEKALRLRGVTFKWRSNPEGRLNIGFIAQEVEQVFPEIVIENSEGFKSISYDSVIPVLLEAMRELNDQHQNEINALQNRIRRLEEHIENKSIAQEGK